MSNDQHWSDVPPQAPQANGSRTPRNPRIVAVVLMLAMSLGGGIIGGIIGSSASNSSSGSPLVTAAPSDPSNIGTSNVARAAAVIAPSIVTIDSVSSSSEAVGTGIIVTSDGEIVTNNHVVEGATSVRVRLRGQTEPIIADVLGADPSNDLALIKLRKASGLTAATFADPASIAVGDSVVAVGYALALDGDPTVTTGIVSALNRTFTIDENTILNGLIQTDTAISSGNSGGPLINMKGEVVGINTAVATGGSTSAANNIGFSIGVREVTRVIAILRKETGTGTREQGFLGIRLGSRTDGGSGAVIGEITSGSPAAEAGLRVDDIVLEVNGQTIDGDAALVAIIRDSSPGDRIAIKVMRDGKKLDLTATLVSRADNQG